MFIVQGPLLKGHYVVLRKFNQMRKIFFDVFFNA